MSGKPVESSATGAFTVRDATPEDIPAVTAIYAHHVMNGVGTFEEVPPDADEIARRHAAVTEAGYPYLVAVDAEGIAGFAYAAQYRARSAYRFTAEDSIYVAPDRARRGVGKSLLAELVTRCTARGCRQMIAVVGGGGNSGSIALHKALGFIETGRLHSAGYKFGAWTDTVLMQRTLGDGADSLP